MNSDSQSAVVWPVKIALPESLATALEQQGGGLPLERVIYQIIEAERKKEEPNLDPNLDPDDIVGAPDAPKEIPLIDFPKGPFPPDSVRVVTIYVESQILTWLKAKASTEFSWDFLYKLLIINTHLNDHHSTTRWLQPAISAPKSVSTTE